MSRYTRSVLQPDETITFEGRLHWIMHIAGVFWLVAGLSLSILAHGLDRDGAVLGGYAALGGAPFLLYGLFRFLKSLFIQWITEVVVTDRRVIQKIGFIARDTAEMNINQVESVEVTQTIPGRLLGYGTVRVHGSGHGMEALNYVANPIGLRTAITAR